MVAPLDHTFPVAAEEVNVTLPPWQMVVEPITEMLGCAGTVACVTIVAAEVAEVHVPLFTVTV